MKQHARGIRRVPDTAALALAFAAVLVSWRLSSTIDDAAISYRYAANAARGLGFVFNPGEYVEGYTNFLWTAVLSVTVRLGLPPAGTAQVLGLGCLAATVLLANVLARRHLPERRDALVATGLVAANMTLLVLTSSGMETGAVALAGVGAALAFDRASVDCTPVRLAVASVVSAVALLLRLDSAVLLAGLAAVLLVRRFREREAAAEVARTVGLLAAPAAVVLAPWLVWKWRTYGALVPNTALAKEGADRLTMVAVGLVFLLVFALSYGAPLLAPAAWRLRRELGDPARLGALVWPSLLWCAYVVWVGADWMEFRFLTIIVPLLAVVGARLIAEVATPTRRWVVVALLGLLSLAHLLPPGDVPLTLRYLRAQAVSATEIGAVLRDAFPGSLSDPSRPAIAMVAVGIVPYESDLRTVDVLGLTDRGIAREGHHMSFYLPGHQRVATIPQLLERKVSLILSQTDYVPTDPGRDRLRLSEVVRHYPVADLNLLPPEASMVEIPLGGEGRVLHAIALDRHPMVEAKVESGEWRRLDIERECRTEDLGDAARLFGTRTCPT